LGRIVIPTFTHTGAVVGRTGQSVAISAGPTWLASAGSLEAAFHIARDASEAWVADADAAVHRDLVTIRARKIAGRAHPSLGTVLAHGNRVVAIAEPAAVAIAAARTVWDLAACAYPAWVASASLNRSIAGSVCCAVDANTRASLPLAELAPEARVAFASTVHALAMIRALSVTAWSVEASRGTADADAAVHGSLRPVHTRNVAHRSHPVGRAVRADRGIVCPVAEAASSALRGAATLRDLAANTSPPRATEAFLSGQVTRAVTRAV